MDDTERQMVERLASELLNNEGCHANDSYSADCQSAKYRQLLMTTHKQQPQMDEEITENLPPLIEDFDLWEESSCCNLSLPVLSPHHYHFRGIFGEYEILIGEQMKGDAVLPDHNDGFCCSENINFEPGCGTVNSDNIVQNGLSADGEQKNDVSMRRKKYGTDRAKDITFAQLSEYFYMPITQAAKKMDVGLTILKRKCREYGIPRWPHRKMKSLRSLIRSIQELGEEDGELGERRSKVAVAELEEQVRLMEVMPAMQLPEDTKRLRQACFKANYKKRRLMSLQTDQYRRSSM